MHIFGYPEVTAPTIIKGWVQGDLLRWESLTAPERMTPFGENVSIPGITRQDGGYRLKDVKPQEWGGHLYGLVHLQKASFRGWLLQDPFCYFKWSFTKLQDHDANWNWFPETEEGWSARTPGWRWDIPGTKGKHWIFTRGRIAPHWD